MWEIKEHSPYPWDKCGGFVVGNVHHSCSAPGNGVSVGDLMKNNTLVGAAIAS